MKKLFFLPLLCLLFTACQLASTKITEIERVAESDPIIPLHLRGEVTPLLLTDYVPTLIMDTSLAVTLGEQTLPMTEDTVIFTTASAGTSVLTITKGNQHVDVPVLGSLPHKQGLYTTGCTNKTISFALEGEAHGELNVLAFWQNELLSGDAVTLADTGDAPQASLYTLTIPAELRKEGRSFIRVFACDSVYLYNDLLIPLQDMRPVTSVKQLTRHDDNAQVLYSLMIDRFQNGNPANDKKLNSEEVLDIVDYMGGDLKGITQKIEEGWFNELGINTIWISPITQNPYDAWGYNAFPEVGKDAEGRTLYANKYDPYKAYTKFSGYHGYWPIYITKVDDRFGTDAELHELLATAHKHDINVVLDYVANHMHINSPTLTEHPTWITDSILPDGRRNFGLWDEARLTTWFDVHIPTLDLEQEYVYEPMTDSALHWLREFDFDGFRHDACKHIPECYWRTLTQKMKTEFPDRHIWMIGETYGSPELLSSYVKTGLLNSQFDFNIYHTAIEVFGLNRSLKDLEHVIEESSAVYGAHHTMGNISGNHDKARFISLAGGEMGFWDDHKAIGWEREVGVGTDSLSAYKKSLLLNVVNLTIPGVPCIYQGDEFGEAGGNDPDNRYMMQFDGYNKYEQDYRNQVRDLIHLRRNSLPLMYGDYLPLIVSDDILAFKRVYMGEEVLVVINKSNEAVELPDLGVTVEPLGYIVK